MQSRVRHCYRLGDFFALFFEHAFSPDAKWPDEPEVHAPPLDVWWRQSTHDLHPPVVVKLSSSEPIKF